MSSGDYKSIALASHSSCGSCIRPAQDQPSQLSRIEMKGAHKSPCLAEELLTVDDHLMKENQFFSVVWPIL